MKAGGGLSIALDDAPHMLLPLLRSFLVDRGLGVPALDIRVEILGRGDGALGVPGRLENERAQDEAPGEYDRAGQVDAG